MRILILIDMSPLSAFLAEVGRSITQAGHEVIWVCESRIPRAKYRLEFEGKICFLTDFDAQCGAKEMGGFGHIMFPNYDRDKELGMWRSGRYSDEVAEKMVCFFERLVRDYQPNAIVYENVSNAFSYAANLVAVNSDVEYFGLIGSRLPNRFEIWRSPVGLRSEISDLLDSGKFSTEEIEFARDYLREKEIPAPDYMKNNPFSHKVNYLRHYIGKLKTIHQFIGLMNREIYLESRKALQSPDPILTPLRLFRRNILRRIRLGVLKKRMVNPAAGEKYFVYPLHYHPESSTSVLAPYYVDEDVLIKNIAFSLPRGVKLYVKDHPNAVGFKPMSFYKDILKLPNIKYIDCDYPVEPLLHDALGVVTLTSTMGYEALLKQKRVIVFGEVFYASHPLCCKITSFAQIKDALENSMAPVSTESDVLREYNEKFVAAYYRNTYSGKLILDPTSAEFKKEANVVAMAISKECL